MRLAAQLQSGGNASRNGLAVEVLFAGTDPPRSWPGRVTRFKAALDQTTRTLPLIVEVDEPVTAESTDSFVTRMQPGMFVTVRIHGRQVDNIHRLPRHLVHDDDTVFLAIDDQLHIRPVTILRRFKTVVLISDGLADGELVITTPVSDAVSGMQIRIRELRD